MPAICSGGGGLDGGEVLGGQLDGQGREIFLQEPLPPGAWDRHHVVALVLMSQVDATAIGSAAPCQRGTRVAPWPISPSIDSLAGCVPAFFSVLSLVDEDQGR
ncbi:hypothetical protein [Nocardia sp. Marseille-Q1738]